MGMGEGLFMRIAPVLGQSQLCHTIQADSYLFNLRPANGQVSLNHLWTLWLLCPLGTRLVRPKQR